MIKENECMNIVLNRFPGFNAAWAKHKNYWGLDEAGFGNDVAEFSLYAKSLIARSDPAVQSIFEFVEECIRDGEESVKTAFTVSFLENILNASDDIDVRQIVKYLGEESKQFCRAWNTFTGVYIPGLDTIEERSTDNR